MTARKLIVSFLGNLSGIELPNGNDWLIIHRVFILLTKWQATDVEPGVRGAVMTVVVTCLWATWPDADTLSRHHPAPPGGRPRASLLRAGLLPNLPENRRLLPPSSVQVTQKEAEERR